MIAHLPRWELIALGKLGQVHALLAPNPPLPRQCQTLPPCPRFVNATPPPPRAHLVNAKSTKLHQHPPTPCVPCRRQPPHTHTHCAPRRRQQPPTLAHCIGTKPTKLHQTPLYAPRRRQPHLVSAKPPPTMCLVNTKPPLVGAPRQRQTHQGAPTPPPLVRLVGASPPNPLGPCGPSSLALLTRGMELCGFLARFARSRPVPMRIPRPLRSLKRHANVHR